MLSGRRSCNGMCLPAGESVQPLGRRKPFPTGPGNRGLSCANKGQLPTTIQATATTKAERTMRAISLRGEGEAADGTALQANGESPCREAGRGDHEAGRAAFAL